MEIGDRLTCSRIPRPAISEATVDDAGTLSEDQADALLVELADDQISPAGIEGTR